MDDQPTSISLTPKQARFVEEYLVDLNATQAAIRAGYSERSARKQGHDNLKNPRIEAAITAAQAARSERTQITADQVVSELGMLAFSNMLDYMTVDDDGYGVVDLSKLTREQVIDIRKEIEVPGTSRAWLAKRHNVSRTTIDNIVSGRTWREAR